MSGNEKHWYEVRIPGKVMAEIHIKAESKEEAIKEIKNGGGWLVDQSNDFDFEGEEADMVEEIEEKYIESYIIEAQKDQEDGEGSDPRDDMSPSRLIWNE